MLAWFDIDYSNLQLKEMGVWPLLPRIVVVIASGLMLSALMYYFWFAVKLELLTRQKLLFNDKYKELVRLQDNLLCLNNARKNIAALQEAYAAYFNGVQDITISKLLDQITNLSVANDLKIISVKVDDIARLEELYRIFPVNVIISGDYHKSAEFMSNIATQLPVQIDSLSFANNVLELKLNIYLEIINDYKVISLQRPMHKIKYHGKNFRNPFAALHVKQATVDVGIVVGSIKNQQHNYALIKDQYGTIHLVKDNVN